MDVVAVVGLGYVGLPLAVAFGKIMPTIGYRVPLSQVHEVTNVDTVAAELRWATVPCGSWK